MFGLVLPHSGKPAVLVPLGVKPPWNQPQVMCWALSRSPMFRPDTTPSGLVLTWPLSEQPSNAGSRSPLTEPLPVAGSGSGMAGAVAGAPVCGFTACAGLVLPEMTFSAPGVEGPNVESQWLSLIA